MESEAPPRRFEIFDAMVLLAALAAGLALDRGLVRRVGRPLTWLGTVSAWTGCVALPVAAALVGLRLRKPRPGWSDIGWQPGMGAGVAVLVPTALVLADEAVTLMVSAVRRGGAGARFAELDAEMIDALASSLPIVAAISVGAAWALQFAYGRWSPERSWIDRAGRAVGVFWIVAGLASWTAQVFGR